MTERPPLDLNALLAEADWLRPLARQLARTSDLDADDLLQDSVEAALTSTGPRDKSKLRPWLRRVMLNLHAMRQRGDTRRRMREEQVAADPGLGAAADPSRPDELVIRAEFRHAVASAMLRMREPYRRTLLWRYFEGWSITRIAKQEGVAAATVRSRVQRGLALLRVDLEQSWGESWRSSCLAIGSTPHLKLAATLAPSAAALLLLSLSTYVVWPNSAAEPTSEIPATIPGLAQANLSENNASMGVATVLAKQQRTPDYSAGMERSRSTVRIRTVNAIDGSPVSSAKIFAIREFMRAGGPDELQHRHMLTLSEPRLSVEPTATSDSDGVAELPTSRESRRIWIEAEGLSGYTDAIPLKPLAWEPPLSDEIITVALWPDVAVPVIAIDSEGDPVAGVHLALRLSSIGSGSSTRSWEGRPRATGFSDASGRLVLRVPGADLIESMDSLQSAEREPVWDVSQALPLNSSKGVRVPVDMLAHPNSHDELPIEIPENGTVLLHVANSPAFARAFLQPFDQEPTPNSGLSGSLATAIEGTQTDEGFLFAGVPLNQEWRAIVARSPLSNQPCQQREVTVIGPTQRDTIREVRLDFEAGARICGTLRTTHSERLLPDFLELGVFLPDGEMIGNPMYFSAELDAPFSLCLDTFLEENSAQLKQVYEQDPHVDLRLGFVTNHKYSTQYDDGPLIGSASVHIPIHDIFDGLDLGDLILGSMAPLVEGRVLDDTGQPLPNIGILVSEKHSTWTTESPRRQIHCRTVTDREGRFEAAYDLSLPQGKGDFWVQARTPTAQSLWAKAPSFPLALVEFLPEDGPLEIRVPTGAAIEIPFINHLPKGLRCFVEIKSDERSISQELPSWGDESDEIPVLVVDGIPFGTYELSIKFDLGMADLQDEKLGRIEIQPEMNPIKPILVADLLRSTRIAFSTSSEADAHDLAKIDLVLLRRPGVTSHLSTEYVVRIGDEFHLFHDQLDRAQEKLGRADGWIMVDGFEPILLNDPWTDQTVQLQRAPKLNLEVRATPTPPEGGHWILLLECLDTPELVRLNRPRVWFGNDRNAMVQLPKAGNYRLRWQVLGSDRTVLQEVEQIRAFTAQDHDTTIALEVPAALVTR